MEIFRINTYKTEELNFNDKFKRFLNPLLPKFNYVVDNSLVLYYNIEENSIYYKDDKKDIATKKDLHRSLIMMYEMVNRFDAFDVRWTVETNNISKFIDTILENYAKIPAQNLLIGSKGLQLEKDQLNLLLLRLHLEDAEDISTTMDNINIGILADEYMSNKFKK